MLHVDETVATLGVFAGHKDCVGVPHQPDVGQVWVIWLGKRQFPRGIIRWYRCIRPVSHLVPSMSDGARNARYRCFHLVLGWGAFMGTPVRRGGLADAVHHRSS